MTHTHTDNWQPATGNYLIIGGGRMGMALAHGLVARGFTPGRITVIEPDDARRTDIAAQQFVTAPTLKARPDTPLDATLLAIKPQTLPAIATELSAFFTGKSRHLLISILAGTTVAQLAAIAPDAAIVRAMPNTPALIGRGVTACVAAAACEASLRNTAEALLTAVGDVVWLEDESQMNAATALSGSGPAYVYYFLECLIAAGITQGLPPTTAQRLAIATLTGAGALAAESRETLAELRRNVTSPGGTTEAALAVLINPESGLAPLLQNTLAAASARAKNMGN